MSEDVQRESRAGIDADQQKSEGDKLDVRAAVVDQQLAAAPTGGYEHTPGEPRRTAPDSDEERVPQVERGGRLYRKKKSNLPFLRAHTWAEVEKRKQQQQLDKQKKLKEQETKDAKTNDKMEYENEKEGSPPVYERTTQVSRTLLRYAAVLVLGTLLLSRAITETWTFGYEGRYTNVMNWIPRPMKTFTEVELAQYDGSRSELPIYLALDGEVYDVSTKASMYGKGASYNHFAGKDAARAYVTGCFKTHLTHDLRGLSPKELKGLTYWKQFFSNHAKYYKVGKVLHDPIAQDAPLPPPCDAKKEGGAR